MKYRWLWAGAGLGVLLNFGGLSWDIYRHVQDATLASREGVFPVTDPAHIMIFSGTALMVASILGVGLLWLQDRPMRDGWLADATRIAMFPLVGLAAAGAIWVVAVALDTAGHTHTDANGQIHVPDAAAVQAVADDVADATTTAGTAHVHDASVSGTGSAAAASAEGAPHIHGTEVAVTADQLAAADAFVAKVKAATAQYSDIRAAMAAGYVQITQDLPGIAAHFEKPAYMNDGDIMDPEKPEFLLYTKRMTGQWQFIGVMFYSETVTDNPPSFFGPLDAWHLHTDLCFTAGAQVATVTDASQCRGVFVAKTAWQMHVWVLPNVNGVFAHDFAPINPGTYPPATLPAAQDVKLVAKTP